MADSDAQRRAEESFRDKCWTEYEKSLSQAGRVYTPISNERLDAQIAGVGGLTALERIDAYIERKSAGNWSIFACERNWKTFKTDPINQKDIVDYFGFSKQTVSAAVNLRAAQGYLRLGDGKNPRLIIFILSPKNGVEVPADDGLPPYSAYKEIWDNEHPVEAQLRIKMEAKRDKLRKQLAKDLEPVIETISKIEYARLNDYKKLKEKAMPKASEAPEVIDQHSLDFDSPIPPPPVQNLTDFPFEESSTSDTSVQNLFDEPSVTSGTAEKPKQHAGSGPIPREVKGIAETEKNVLRARADSLNIKQFRDQSHPSVGRSSLETPTDRPTGDSGDNRFKDRIREWLEETIKLPVGIEDPELGQIAATIQTDLHFQQFKEAMGKAKKVKGWRYCVTVALDCQKHQAKYAAASAGSQSGKEDDDPYLKALRRAREREGDKNG